MRSVASDKDLQAPILTENRAAPGTGFSVLTAAPAELDFSIRSFYTYPMLARVYSCAVIGLEGVIVEVEVDTGDGLPSIVMVGTIDQFLPAE